MTGPFTMFLILLSAAFSLNAFVSWGYKGWPYPTLLSVSFLMAIYVRGLIWDSELLDLPQKLRAYKESPQWFFYFGRISSDKGEVEQALKDLFRNLSNSAIFWMQAGFFVWFLGWKYYFFVYLGQEFSFLFFFYVWICWLILHSWHQNQFLIIFAISVAMSLVTLSGLKPQEYWMLLPNLVLYLMAFTVFRKFHRSTNAPGSRLMAVVFSTVFIISMTLVVHTMIEKFHGKPEAKIEESSIQDRLSEKIAEQAVKFADFSGESGGESKGPGPVGPSGQRPGNGDSKTVSNRTLGGVGGSSGGGGGGGRSNSGGSTDVDMENISRKLSQLERQIQKLPGGGGVGGAGSGGGSLTGSGPGRGDGRASGQPGGEGLSRKDLEKNLKQLQGFQKKLKNNPSKKAQKISKQLEGQIQKLEEQLTRQSRGEKSEGDVAVQTSDKAGNRGKVSSQKQVQQRIRKLQERLQKVDSKQAQNEIENIQKQLEKLNQTAAGTGGTGSGEGSGSSGNVASGGGGSESVGSGENGQAPSARSVGAASEDLTEEAKKDRMSVKLKIENIKQKIKSFMGLIEKALKAALVMFIVFVIYQVWTWMQKKDPEKVETKPQGLTESDRKILSKRYSALKSKNLKPEEEVSETYNLFLQSMFLMEYPKEPWVTASDFQGELEQDYKTLKDCTRSITEIYCETHYGERPVPPETITRLRSARDQLIKLVS